MEITLNIYKAKGKHLISNEIERVAKAQDFELTTGVCEDVLNIINIDMFSGGVSALSDESKEELFLSLVKDGYPFFVELIKDIFEINDDEAKRLKLADVVKVVVSIVKYAFTQLGNAIGGKTEKN